MGAVRQHAHAQAGPSSGPGLRAVLRPLAIMLACNALCLFGIYSAYNESDSAWAAGARRAPEAAAAPTPVADLTPEQREARAKEWWENQRRADAQRRKELADDAAIRTAGRAFKSRSVVLREFADLRGKNSATGQRRVVSSGKKQVAELASDPVELDPETYDAARATGIRSDAPPLGASLLWKRFAVPRDAIQGAPSPGRVSAVYAGGTFVVAFEVRDADTGRAAIHVARRSAAPDLKDDAAAEDAPNGAKAPQWTPSAPAAPGLPANLQRRVDARRTNTLRQAKKRDSRGGVKRERDTNAMHGEFLEAAAAVAVDKDDTALTQEDREALLYVKTYGRSDHITPVLHHDATTGTLHLLYVVVPAAGPVCSSSDATAAAARRTRGGAVFSITSNDQGRTWNYPARALQDASLWPMGLGALNGEMRLGAGVLMIPASRRGKKQMPETWLLPFVRDADACTNTEAYSSIATLVSEDRGESWHLLNVPTAADFERGAGKPGAGTHFADPQLVDVPVPLLGVGIIQRWVLGMYRGLTPSAVGGGGGASAASKTRSAMPLGTAKESTGGSGRGKAKQSKGNHSSSAGAPAPQEVHAHLYWSKSYDAGRRWEPSNRVSADTVPYSFRDLGLMGGAPFYATLASVGFGDSASEVLLVAHNDHAGDGSFCAGCRTRLRLSAVRDLGIGLRDGSREFGSLGRGQLGALGSSGPLVQPHLVQLENRREPGLQIHHPVIVHTGVRLPGGKPDNPLDAKGCVRVWVLYSVAYAQEDADDAGADRGQGVLNARYGHAHADLEQVWQPEPQGVKEALVRVCDTPRL